jgi:hypothetical protein
MSDTRHTSPEESVEATPENHQESTETPKDAMEYFGYDPEQIVDSVAESAKEDQPNTIEAIQAKVNQVLKEIKVDDNGKFIYPEGLDPAIRLAVAKEKAFRDTQAEFTRSRQELKQKEAELAALREQIAKYETPEANLTPEERKELEELKYINPDEWYKRMRALEAQAKEKVKEKLDEVQKEARQKTEAEIRKEILEEFNKSRETPLTQEVLELEIPPKYHKMVANGEISYIEFLEKAAAFLDAPKRVATPELETTTNIHTVPSGSIDHEKAPEIDYSSITF